MKRAQCIGLVLAMAALAAAGPLIATDEMPSSMGTVYLVLLKKGPAWSATETPESKSIQEAHMAGIRAMWHDKKLILAGPMGDNGEIRGIFLFQAGSLDEARALAEKDPAIKAGRLVAEIHPWWVDRRALPEAGKYCQSVDPP